jgi:hypothetical protein
MEGTKKIRKVARKLAYRKRFRALSSKEQVKLRKYKKLIFLYLTTEALSDDGLDPDESDIYMMVLTQYLAIALDEDGADNPGRRPDRKRTLASFTNSECKIFFQFNRAELIDLIPRLGLPERCILENGINMPGEEVFLRGLFEMVSADNQERMAANVFGREFSAQSRAFKFFTKTMYSNFHHLVHDNLAWFFRNGLTEASAFAIGKKMGLDDPSSNLVSHFIDCNCEPCCVTGGGPAEAGANAMRWDETIQRAFYNGWKSVHGLKHQTINDAFGICPDMWGPCSLRRNDLFALRMSRIVARFRAVQVGNRRQYIIMGDSAYKKQSHITSYHNVNDQLPYRRWWNLQMKRLRVSIEWDYGYTATMFKYVASKNKLKLLSGEIVTEIYTVATLLRNIHAGYYGSQTSNYFECTLPDDFVACYLTQTDFV